jgi:hypothetical protein
MSPKGCGKKDLKVHAAINRLDVDLKILRLN